MKKTIMKIAIFVTLFSLTFSFKVKYKKKDSSKAVQQISSLCMAPQDYNASGTAVKYCYLGPYTNFTDVLNDCPLDKLDYNIHFIEPGEAPSVGSGYVCYRGVDPALSECPELGSSAKIHEETCSDFFDDEKDNPYMCHEFIYSHGNLDQCCSGHSVCTGVFPFNIDSNSNEMCDTPTAFDGSEIVVKYCRIGPRDNDFSPQDCPAAEHYHSYNRTDSDDESENGYYCSKMIQGKADVTDCYLRGGNETSMDTLTCIGLANELSGMNIHDACEHFNLNKCCPGSSSVCHNINPSCSEGMIQMNGKCFPCFAGTVPNPERTTCMPCPGGTYSVGFHDDCKDCEAGFYALPGSNTCQMCEAGTFSDNVHAPLRSRCWPCEVGKTSHPGAAECTQCASLH